MCTVDPTGLGVLVDPACRAIAADGRALDALRVLGPPTAGVFGDPLGTVFIAAQIARVLDDLLETLAAAPPSRRGQARPAPA
jgi:uncharacterized NAD(P)/FAD-binding protein YdhS